MPYIDCIFDPKCNNFSLNILRESDTIIWADLPVSTRYHYCKKEERTMTVQNINSGIPSGEIYRASGSREGSKAENTETAAGQAPADSVQIGQSQEPPKKKELTVLFYIHGQYPDLAKAKARDFMQLENVGSDENVNVVAELGRAPQTDPKKPFNIDGDWSGVRRYYVTHQDHSNIEMSLAEWQAVEQKIPNNPLAHYNLGNALYELGDKEQAKLEYAKAKELGIQVCLEKPDSPKAKKMNRQLDKVTKPFEEAHQKEQIYGSPVLETLPEGTKIGDPATLKDFVSWGMKNYPAEHYVLVITGHGGAWIGALEINPDKMNKAITEGVAQASKDTGEQKKLDAVVFNSCYMGNAESSYQMRNAADIIIGSENYSKGTFSHWGDHLKRIEDGINTGGGFDKKAFAKDFIEYYREKGSDIKENFPEYSRWKETFLTLTAIDTSQMEKVTSSWKGFVDACKAGNVPEHEIFREFAKKPEYVSSSSSHKDSIFIFYDMIRDMGRIMENVRENPVIPESVKAEAAKVQAALNDAVIAEQHEGKNMDGSTGITVWAPTNAVDVAMMADRYEKENVPDFNAKTGYLSFLKNAVSHADQAALKNFLGDMQILRGLNKILADPKIVLSEEEKKTVQDAKGTITEHAMKLKEKLVLTEPRVKSMFGLAFAEKPDFAAMGDMSRDFVNDALGRSTPKGGG